MPGIVVQTIEVIAASKAREEKEANTRAQLTAGKLGLDIYGMRDKLKAKGLRYVASAAELTGK
jgi:4-hydroxy-4-methyl-2-oxoglutarate aldolase